MGTRIALLKDGVVQQFGTPREIYEPPPTPTSRASSARRR